MSDYALILLTGKNVQGRSAKVSVNFAYLATESSWCVDSHGYAMRYWKGKHQFLHHAILPRQKGLEIDHINRCKLDNRIENLRLVTRSQNQRNVGVRKDSQLAVKNVCFDKRAGKFAVNFRVDGKRVYVGHFETIGEAIKKRDEAKQAHGYYF